MLYEVITPQEAEVPEDLVRAGGVLEGVGAGGSDDGSSDVLADAAKAKSLGQRISAFAQVRPKHFKPVMTPTPSRFLTRS